MKSLRDIVESSPHLRATAMHSLRLEEEPQPLGPPLWDWAEVRSVLVIRLRSIGDTVLATPSLHALKRFLPDARIDILVEDWVAPVLEGFPYVDNVLTLKRNSTTARARAMRQLRSLRYDVVYNLHGGTTATLLTRASGATRRVGLATYQYSRLYTHLAPSPLILWKRAQTHSVEQQLALLGWTGVPVSDRPPTQLAVVDHAAVSVSTRLRAAGWNEQQPLAVIHPAAAFATKQWSAENFARVAEHLYDRGLAVVVITAPAEAEVGALVEGLSAAPVINFSDLSLPEVTALASRARVFVGNDSGIAHIAAAVGLPSVVIFGSSNVAHWRPWATAPAEVVLEEMDCQPCHGYYCEKFAQPECILRVPLERVIGAVDRVLRESEWQSRNGDGP
ncbi:MAG TPA: glycosyltransferase family 9 protein [Pyrinomonadaceae bacterium]|nr:glycosyltransferase family 9 protein [Pyrinomonadaceae bacterium]